jgi:outer membrane protein OmpA-like peptidoglycan-associated protein
MGKFKKGLIVAALAIAATASATAGFGQSSASSPSSNDGQGALESFGDQVVRVIPHQVSGGDGAEGFGFVVSANSDSLIIATANHVVRNSDNPYTDTPEVIFHQNQARRYAAQILPQQLAQGDGDLALLRIERPKWFVRKAFETVGGIDKNNDVWRIGKTQRWSVNTIPGRYAGPDDDRLRDDTWAYVDNLDTPVGSSGAPALVGKAVAGMVVDDGGQSGFPSKLLLIDKIATQVQDWGLPWNEEFFSPEIPDNQLGPWMVYFNANRSDLSGIEKIKVNAMTRIAIDLIQQGKINVITITGHADTVGSNAYSVRLSRRTGETVANEMTRSGVPSSIIEIIGRGKTDQIRPTADGVPEEDNRVVIINFEKR